MELAAQYGSDEPVRIRTIAESHGIPSRFLVQILLQLKGAGFVSSTRGAAGGYKLIRDPAEVTLGDVMFVIDGTAKELNSNTRAQTAKARALLDAWREVARVEREMLAAITIADLLERAGGNTENMYYI